MADFNKDPLVTPYFYVDAVQDKTATEKEGRPIFRDEEFVEVRIAGDRNFAPVFPAHAMWERRPGEFGVEEVTYAMRWPEQYRRFKEGTTQVAEGTPLEELPFLTVARRSELKALKIYTAEALATLDGKNIKVLAGEGYKLKEQAQAYLDKARGTAGVVQTAARMVELQAQLDTAMEQIARLQQGQAPIPTVDVPAAANTPITTDENVFDPHMTKSDDELKELIAQKVGQRPRGNPNRSTLLNMLAAVEA